MVLITYRQRFVTLECDMHERLYIDEDTMFGSLGRKGQDSVEDIVPDLAGDAKTELKV